MSTQNYYQYIELQKLIARYDWAVEGFPAPFEQINLTRESAIEIRNSLVKLAHEIQL